MSSYQETQNPNGNVQSFDTIYAAALQVIVVASANTVSGLNTHKAPGVTASELTRHLSHIVVVAYVLRDRRRILHIMRFLHHLHRCP